MGKKNVCALALILFFLPISFSSCGEEKRSQYRLNCEYDQEANALTGELEFTYYNDTQKDQSVLWFQLYPNAYRKDAAYAPLSPIRKAAYYDGESFGGIRLNEVKNCRTYEIGGEDKNILFVTLNEPVGRGEETTVTISFVTTLAKVEHRLGVTKQTINLCNFYPILCGYDEADGFYECVYYSDGDPFYSAAADYSLTIKVPSDYELACTGEMRKETFGGTAQYVVSGEDCRDIACALSTDWKTAEAQTGDVVVRYYYYKDENPEDTLAVATRAIEYFSREYGAYEWKTYTIAETGFCYGGMEYPALSLISDSVDAAMRREIVVHETAHQWWYAMVGNNECEHAWMDEGLAEYSAMKFFDEYDEYGISGQEKESGARKAFHSYCGIYRQLFGEVDVSLDRSLSSFISEYEYANIAYGKGSILFCCIEDEIGEKRARETLQKYFSRYSGKTASPADLISCFPKSVKGIFTSFLDGTAVIG